MFGEREIIIFINHGGCFICGCYAIINNSFLFWMLNAVYKETERHPGQRSELPDITWISAPYFEPGNFLRSTSLVLMSTLSLLKKRGFFYRTLQKFPKILPLLWFMTFFLFPFRDPRCPLPGLCFPRSSSFPRSSQQRVLSLSPRLPLRNLIGNNTVRNLNPNGK